MLVSHVYQTWQLMKQLAKLSVVLYHPNMTNTFILGVALVILTCSINVVQNISNFEAKVDEFLKEVIQFILCFFYQGGLWFFVWFRIFFSDNTRVRILIFFVGQCANFFLSEFNIRLYDKNSESHYFFFLHQNQNIFFSNIGNQNIFFRKKT